MMQVDRFGHEQVSWWRRRSRIAEVSTGWLPEQIGDGHAEMVDLRLVMRAALARLTPRQHCNYDALKDRKALFPRSE
jgi:hypothetical protein